MTQYMFWGLLIFLFVSFGYIDRGIKYLLDHLDKRLDKIEKKIDSLK